MVDNTDYAFPAGDESDGSSDEWDFGCIRNTEKLDPEVKLRLQTCPADTLAK